MIPGPHCRLHRIQWRFREIQETPVFSGLAAIVGILALSLLVLFASCSVGKIEEKPRLANPNATFLSQELDGDGKSDDAVANDQPTGSSIVLLPGCQLRFDE